MKTKYAILPLLLLACSCLLMAQSHSDGETNVLSCGDAVLKGLDYQGSNALMREFVISDMRGSGEVSTQVSEIKGSPYLAENFQKANLFYDDKAIGSLYARYNAYSNEMEVKKTNLEEEQFMALVKDENLKIVFPDKQLQFVSLIDEKGKKHEDYLIAVKEGNKYGVFERLTVNYKEGRKAENSMVADVPNRFTQSTEFYLKDNATNIIAQLPGKKSKLLNLFPEKDRGQVASLIKKNKLDLKDAADLIKICDFMNSAITDYASSGE